MSDLGHPPGGPPRRVLVIKPSSLGDVVTAVPVLRGLKRTFPSARISWLLSNGCAPLLQQDSDLDEVILFDRKLLGGAWRSPTAALALLRLLRTLRRGRFDWVIDLQGLLRSGLLAAATRAGVRAGFDTAREGAWLFYTHRLTAPDEHVIDRNISLARQLGIDARPEDLVLQVPPEGRSFAEDLCRGHGLRRGGFLVCFPPTRWPTKVYPVRRWRQAIGLILRHCPVVLLGAPGDQAVGRAVAEGLDGVLDLTGQTALPQMIGLIAACGGVVCSDSAANFIAPAVGVDTVTLVGPTRPLRTGPYRRGKALVAPVPCRGCLRRRCRHVTCMDTIQPADVAAAAVQMLASGSR